MSLRYGFFNSVDGDRRYNADDISDFFLKLISNGVFATPATAMQVQASSGMSVQVSAGWAFIKCKYLSNTAPYVLTLDAADVVLGRIDRIVVRLNADEAHRSMGIYVRKGTAASSPVAPTLTRTATTYEISLAAIRVSAGATSISQSDITDERGNTSVCGYVTGLIDQIDTTNLFAQYNSAFYNWFEEIKEDVTTTTLVRSYHSTYTTHVADESTIPINISQYNSTLDVLGVFVNGMKLIEGTDYTIDGVTATIELATALSEAGTTVEFEILKSIDGSEAESVVQAVYELQEQVGALMSNVYLCNGVNDNVAFKNFLDDFLDTHDDATTVRVVGSFGVNNLTTAASDGYLYSMVYVHDGEDMITIDFADCNVVDLQYGNGFAFFGNCRIKNLRCRYPNTVNSRAITCLGGANAVFEGCSVRGALSGLYQITVYGITDSALISCSSDLSGYDTIVGVSAVKSWLVSCDIAVDTRSLSADATGISTTKDASANGCRFTATTAATASSSKAVGGYGGGSFMGCTFVGKSALKAYGYYLTSAISASCCTFRGYTKNATDGWGMGFSSNNSTGNTLILTGANCDAVSETGYTQTKSMTVGNGSGSYSGWFFDTPTVGSGIVSYGAFVSGA